MQYRSPVKEARGLGSAGHGVGHWWAQRVTAIALVPLMLWLVIGVAANTGAGYEAAVDWLGAPINAVLMMLTLVAMFYHGSLGIQVVLEDYVHPDWLRRTLVVAVNFAAIVLASAAVFAVLMIALGD